MKPGKSVRPFFAPHPDVRHFVPSRRMALTDLSGTRAGFGSSGRAGSQTRCPTATAAKWRGVGDLHGHLRNGVVLMGTRTVAAEGMSNCAMDHVEKPLRGPILAAS